MRTLLKFFGVILLSVVIFSGCNENTSETSPVSSDQGSLLKGSKVVANITGSGNFVVGGKMRVFTFNARSYSDGSVDGHFNLNRTDVGVHYSGSITCISIEGNKASFVGIIENSNNPGIPVGNYQFFAIADNGQGKNAPPDQITLSFYGLTPEDVEFFCGGFYDPDTDPDLDWYNVESGNIVIHN